MAVILAIDIGNISVDLGVFDNGGGLAFVSRMEAARNRTADEYAVDITNLFALNGAKVKDVTGSIISSVVPPLTPVFEAAALKLTGKSPLIVGPGVKTGLNIMTELHTQLGSDLVSNAVAALSRYKPPMIIIDIGTATTISAVGVNGAFLGCAIFPGVSVSLDALSAKAAQLPYISVEAPSHVIGKNTIDSMRSGIIYGTAGMIESIVERMEAEIGATALIVATGENIRHILKYCKRKIIYEKDLLMYGLYDIFKRNSDK